MNYYVRTQSVTLRQYLVEASDAAHAIDIIERDDQDAVLVDITEQDAQVIECSAAR